ncbi:MAG: dihydrolipoyllysine-residue acetyltransferase [bacterium]
MRWRHSRRSPTRGRSRSRRWPRQSTATGSTPTNRIRRRCRRMANTMEVKVPDIGDFKDVPVVEIMVSAGARIEKEDPLISLESDKATIEVPAPASGTVKSIELKVGDKVSQGTLVLMLETDDAAVAPAPAPAVVSAPAPAAPTTAAPAPSVTAPPPAPVAVSAAPVAADTADDGQAAAAPGLHASPSVRRFARELGVDLTRVAASGPKARILKEDVQTFVKQTLAAPPAPAAVPSAGLPFNLPPMPQVDFSKFGPVESLPLSRIQKLSGPNLHRNWVSIPHVTQFDEVDITELEAFRKAQLESLRKQGVRLTVLAFLVKAVAGALREFPTFNASLAPGGDALVLKKYFHVGVAVDTPDGLVVPVIRDCDRKGVADIARELASLSEAARERKLKATDMQGGCFSISSLGGIGGTAFTPIINAPEVAILGVSKATIRPVFSDGTFVPRLMLPLSLSYDHRVVDGATGARFIAHLNGLLSDVRRLLL